MVLQSDEDYYKRNSDINNFNKYKIYKYICIEIERGPWDFSSLGVVMASVKSQHVLASQKHMEPNACFTNSCLLVTSKRYGLLFCITHRATSILFFCLFCFLLLSKTVLSVVLKLFSSLCINAFAFDLIFNCFFFLSIYCFNI